MDRLKDEFIQNVSHELRTPLAILRGYAEMLASGTTADGAMRAMGIEEVDQSDLENLCRELLDANPKIVQDVKEGRLKAAGSLIGQAKKKNPNVNPGQVRDLCLQLIERM